MKIRSFKFYIKEVYTNIFRNAWMIFASIFTIFCCLVIFGIFLSLSLNASYMIKEVQADYDIPVIVDGSKSLEELDSIANRIKVIPGVSKIEIVSKDEGLKIVREMLKDYQGAADGLENDNPLRHTIKVSLSDLQNADQIIEKIKTIKGVESINTKFDVRDTLIGITNFINTSCLWVMLVLVIVSVYIISNTIKLSVFTRRKEINIMKFVGATDWFIRWPFLIEGVVIGLIGCTLAFTAVTISYNFVLQKFTESGIDIIPMLDYNTLWPIMLVSFVFFSVILGTVGSFISIRKHLKV